MEQLNPDDMSVLVLPGGTAWEDNPMGGIDKLLEALHSRGKIIAGICGATVYLGKKGYLDSVKHTSNALDYLKYMAPNYKGEKLYQSEASVSDKNIITANGISPIEFARDIFSITKLNDKDGIDKWFQLFKHGVWAE